MMPHLHVVHIAQRPQLFGGSWSLQHRRILTYCAMTLEYHVIHTAQCSGLCRGSWSLQHRGYGKYCAMTPDLHVKILLHVTLVA